MPDNSNKNFLVVVHGMGEHTRESVETDVRNTLSSLEGWQDDAVDLRVIAYDKIFNDWRQRAADDWSNTIDLLKGRVHFSGVKDWLENAIDVNEQGIFQTHWLDVVLFMSTLGVQVQIEVATQLTRIFQEFNRGDNLDRRNFVLIGHSLGTAVLHDTLHKMIKGGFEDRLDLTLSSVPIRINALFQIANTSRLLKTGINPVERETAVRPSPGALMQRMYNVWHRYDPVALVKQFKIKNLNQWLPEWDFPEDSYYDVRLTGATQFNTHALSHYLEDPRVHMPLFHQLFSDYSYPDDKEARIAAHDARTLPEIDAIKQTIAEAQSDFDRVESMLEIARAWKVLSEGLAADVEALKAAINALAR